MPRSRAARPLAALALARHRCSRLQRCSRNVLERERQRQGRCCAARRAAARRWSSRATTTRSRSRAARLAHILSRIDVRTRRGRRRRAQARDSRGARSTRSPRRSSDALAKADPDQEVVVTRAAARAQPRRLHRTTTSRASRLREGRPALHPPRAHRIGRSRATAADERSPSPYADEQVMTFRVLPGEAHDAGRRRRASR